MSQVKNQKTTHIDRLLRERKKQVEVLMSQKGISITDIEQATGLKADSIGRAIAGRINSVPVIAFLEQQLGSGFSALWRDYPNNAA
ncbi:MAG: hypothetical protein FVQ81_13200 [Candidatus Glassbacteria bacterium]|nr:hypothetical protein [Candidatus Glassbacteria bacterium]